MTGTQTGNEAYARHQREEQLSVMSRMLSAYRAVEGIARVKDGKPVFVGICAHEMEDILGGRNPPGTITTTPNKLFALGLITVAYKRRSPRNNRPMYHWRLVKPGESPVNTLPDDAENMVFDDEAEGA